MKRKKSVFMLVGIMIMVLVYFGYKVFFLYYYSIGQLEREDYQKVIDGLKVNKTITVQTEMLKEDAYLTFQNVKVKNVFSSFKRMEENSEDISVRYALYNEQNKVEAAFLDGNNRKLCGFISKRKCHFYDAG